MSIFATILSLDDYGHSVDCDRWIETTKEEARNSGRMSVSGDRYWRWDDSAACSCGDQPPIIYRGSHVNPSADDPRGGALLVCDIPDHCHPDARGRDDDTGRPVEFLRLVASEDETTYGGSEPGQATLVLDLAQVTELRDTLTEWIETRRPAEATAVPGEEQP